MSFPDEVQLGKKRKLLFTSLKLVLGRVLLLEGGGLPGIIAQIGWVDSGDVEGNRVKEEFVEGDEGSWGNMSGGPQGALTTHLA